MPDDREQFAENAKKSGDVMERARELLADEVCNPDFATELRMGRGAGGTVYTSTALRAIAAALTQSHDQVARKAANHLRDKAKSFRQAAFKQGRRAGPLASGFEAAADEIEKRYAALPAQPDREPSDG